MNERIRKLAEQAWDSTRDEIGSFVDDGGEVNWDFLHTYDKKFAELIVAECCSKLEEMGESWHEFARNPPDGQAHNSSGALFAAYRLKEDAVDEIREHFGVEE
jgi:hypothetical protein